jgi:hypothetical protein
MWVVILTFRPLYSQYTADEKLNGPLKSCSCRESNTGHPLNKQPIYWLSCPGNRHKNGTYSTRFGAWSFGGRFPSLAVMIQPFSVLKADLLQQSTVTLTHVRQQEGVGCHKGHMAVIWCADDRCSFCGCHPVLPVRKVVQTLHRCAVTSREQHSATPSWSCDWCQVENVRSGAGIQRNASS